MSKPEILMQFQMPCAFASADRKTRNKGKHEITVGITNGVLTYIKTECERHHDLDYMNIIPTNQPACSTYRAWLLALVDGKHHRAYSHGVGVNKDSAVSDEELALNIYSKTPLGFAKEQLGGSREKDRELARKVTNDRYVLHRGFTDIVQAVSNSGTYSVLQDTRSEGNADFVLAAAPMYDDRSTAYWAIASSDIGVSLSSASSFHGIRGVGYYTSKGAECIRKEVHYCSACKTYTKRKNKHEESAYHNKQLTEVVLASCKAFEQLMTAEARANPCGLLRRRLNYGLSILQKPFYQRKTAGNVQKYIDFYSIRSKSFITGERMKLVQVIENYFRAAKNCVIPSIPFYDMLDDAAALGFTRQDCGRFIKLERKFVADLHEQNM